MNADKRPFDLRLSENIEAIAISVAMALVLKFFVVEAYQIPTGSMQPTILGDRMAGIKDRIFADKLVTMLRKPRRWEVMIFRFPLDERRLYVKRIVGLPGETLQVQGGDVWIDGAIARKPDHVNASVLKRVYPLADHGGVDLGRAFMGQGGVDLQDDVATFPATGGELTLRKPPVQDAYLHGYDPDWGIRSASPAYHAVPDVDVTLTARLEQDGDILTVAFDADDLSTVFELGTRGGRVRLVPHGAGAPQEIPLAEGLALPVGEAVEVVARSVDRRLVLWVDGEEWLRHDDDVSPPRPDDTTRSDIRLALSGAGQVSRVDIKRDIHYLPKTPLHHSSVSRWEIPDDSYFGMGDNTQNSHDSRTWETMTYGLTDGRELTGFWFDAGAGPGPAPPDANPRRLRNGSMVWADTHGDEWTLWPHDIETQERRAAPFIHQRYLLGKAVAVFWPVFDPFRWKLIR